MVVPTDQISGGRYSDRLRTANFGVFSSELAFHRQQIGSGPRVKTARSGFLTSLIGQTVETLESHHGEFPQIISGFHWNWQRVHEWSETGRALFNEPVWCIIH